MKACLGAVCKSFTDSSVARISYTVYSYYMIGSPWLFKYLHGCRWWSYIHIYYFIHSCSLFQHTSTPCFQLYLYLMTRRYSNYIHLSTVGHFILENFSFGCQSCKTHPNLSFVIHIIMRIRCAVYVSIITMVIRYSTWTHPFYYY